MKERFKFRDLLLEYLFVLGGIQDKLKRGIINNETANTLRYYNLDWLHWTRGRTLEDKEIFTESRDKRKLNNKKFLLPEEKRCPGCDDGKPYRIITYRGIEIPVYDDDYGQQDFAIVLGQEISGGSYNFFSVEEFIDASDRLLEEKFLLGEYDMRKEINDLFPEWERID